MTRDEAVTLIKQRLGNNTNPDLDQQIINEMVHVQEFLLEGEDFIPWFLLKEEAATLANINEPRLELPEDFLHEWEEGCLYLVKPGATLQQTSYIPLIKDDYDVIRNRHYGYGTPCAYDFAGNFFWLAPIPDAAHQLRMVYYGKAESLATQNIENVWLKYAADWFIGEVGTIIAGQYQQSDKQVPQFVAQAARGKQRTLVRHISHQEVNKRRIVGGIDYGFGRSNGTW